MKSLTVPTTRHPNLAKAFFAAAFVFLGFHVQICHLQSNELPTVEITHPLPNFLYTSLSIIRFEASAQDADGSVTNVQFLVNSNLIGSVSQSPFTLWTTNEFDWGSYFAEAVAYDDQGASNGSSVVRFRVVLDTVPIVLITSPMNGDVFSTSETVEIEAFVNITDDGSNPVVFFDGETKLGDGCSFSIPF